MTRSAGINEQALLSKPRLLITESVDEYDALSAALVDLINPRNIIEHIYVSDVAQIAWEIARLRSCKTIIINTVYRTALKDLLTRELGIDYRTAEALAQDWFSDNEAKKQVAEIL